MTIIASNKNKKLKLICEKFEKTNIVLGVYKFKNHGNCTMNNQTLDNTKLYNKELIFENIDLELKTHQISNKTLALKQMREQEIIINEIPLIQSISERNNEQTASNVIIIIIIIIILILLLTIIMCKRLLTALVRRVKFKQTMGELSNTQPATSALLNSTRHVQIEIPPRTPR